MAPVMRARSNGFARRVSYGAGVEHCAISDLAAGGQGRLQLESNSLCQP